MANDLLKWEPNEREQEWLDSHKNIRSYEVSIWTLQDDFITVLKFAHIENKGQIQEGKITLNVDGTQELNFTIPMYIYNSISNTFEENPIWYNTQNGNIVIDMRKIKVIFNKTEDTEKVYEFLITKVEERHSNNQLFCDVTCEGLAFHELGKIGYKISLTAQDFYNEDYDWFMSENRTGEPPKANLQYWLNKFLISTKPSSNNEWYYIIDMNYDAFSGVRNSTTVYEEPYASSWNTEGAVLTTEGLKEKERLVDLEESNIYNLTQNLAETFEVFCRYEYDYDENYHITGRKIIFYNNYFFEDKGYLDFTYPFSSSEISKEMDSTDLITKMYVKQIEDDTTASGLLSIIDTEANKTGEDYLLNFDYLHSIGTISEEQYKAISTYENTMKNYNINLKPYETTITALSAQLPSLEAKAKIASNAVLLDSERISAAKDLYNELTDGTGFINITSMNPATAVLLEDSTQNNGSYYINLSRHGIDVGTLKIYREFDVTQPEESRLKKPINLNNIKIYTDDFGDATKVYNLYKNDEIQSNLVYLTYSYSPKLYYDRVIQTWTERLSKDEADEKRYSAECESIKSQIEEAKNHYEALLNDKKEEIKKFERLMGPALREGYWAPDDYKDCGDKYNDEIIISSSLNSSSYNNNLNSKKLLNYFLWDNDLFNNESGCEYETGAEQTHKKYPCINLSRFFSSGAYFDPTNSDFKKRIEELSFFFADYNTLSGAASLYPGQMRSFSVGSQCNFRFVCYNNQVVPVLILNGIETLPESIDVSFLKNHDMYLGTLSVKNKNLVWKYGTSSGCRVYSSDWIDSGNYYTVFPRMCIKSLAVKTSSDQLFVTYNKESLENFEDFYCFSKISTVPNENEAYYYITLKPETVLKLGGLGKIFGIRYIISNADTAIYLDAKKILKENAYPKVSYQIKLNSLNKDFLHDSYNKLCYIAHINDAELKFQNTMGYISQVNLNLDKPWEDEVEIKNYKTKFEDLFSTILASTEEMKKNGYALRAAASAFNAYGSIKPWALEDTIYKVDLDYAFNQGTLTITESDGIWGVSESGVVAIRGGGIFTSTENDGNGNWKWNTGITPEGINATLITAGQIDTNRVMVYAGDKLRFQLNGNGLFAYKSFFEDLEAINDWEKPYTSTQNSSMAYINNKLKENNSADLDATQFVKLDANGLFLIAKESALVLNRDKSNYLSIGNNQKYEVKYKELSYQDGKLKLDGNGKPVYNIITEKKTMSIPEEGIKRVEISWDGIIMRDWTNTKTFFADPDTGDLYLTGTIFSKNFYMIDDSYDANNLNGNNNYEGKRISWNDYLGELFGIAGEVLADVQTAGYDLGVQTEKNFQIFNSFQTRVQERLKIRLYKGPRTATDGGGWDFKPGDQWKPNSDNKTTYLAMASWSEVWKNIETAKHPDSLASFKGWAKINDDQTLAEISGAKIYEDAEIGIISLWASEGIRLFTEARVDNATGLGGQNRAALELTQGGIYLSASKEIELGVGPSFDKDDFKDDQGSLDPFSGIRISDEDGIWIGSNKEIRLFAGESTKKSSATVLIDPNQILFGVVGETGRSVTKMTEDKIIMGVITNSILPNEESEPLLYREVIDGSDEKEYENIAVFNANTGLRITKNKISLVSAVQQSNTKNIVLLDGDGLKLFSGTVNQSNSGTGSSIFIRPNELIMVSAGTVQLRGKKGEILFGTDASHENANFYVTKEGEVYCKSFTCESGISFQTNIVPSSGSTSQSLGTLSLPLIRTNSETESYINSGSWTNVNVSQSGEYILTVNYQKDGGENGESGYIEYVVISVENVVYGRGSFPFNKSETSKSYNYTLYLVSGINQIDIKIKVEKGYTISSLTATGTLYPNFKSGSAEGSINAGWSNRVYTAIDSNTNTTLASTTISGSWANGIYTVKGTQGNQTVNTGLSVEAWNTTFGTYSNLSTTTSILLSADSADAVLAEVNSKITNDTTYWTVSGKTLTLYKSDTSNEVITLTAGCPILSGEHR